MWILKTHRRIVTLVISEHRELKYEHTYSNTDISSFGHQVPRILRHDRIIWAPGLGIHKRKSPVLWTKSAAIWPLKSARPAGAQTYRVTIHRHEKKARLTAHDCTWAGALSSDTLHWDTADKTHDEVCLSDQMSFHRVGKLKWTNISCGCRCWTWPPTTAVGRGAARAGLRAGEDRSNKTLKRKAPLGDTGVTSP